MKSARPILAVVATAIAFVATPSAADSTTPTPSTVAPKSCGVGVCKRTVTPPQMCTPGQPVTQDDGWIKKADETSGSWDANCDGKVEKQPLSDQVAQYAQNCGIVRGEGCVSRPRIEHECGEKVSLHDKCMMVTDAKGIQTCRGGVLKGAFVQACR